MGLHDRQRGGRNIEAGRGRPGSHERRGPKKGEDRTGHEAKK